MITIYSNLDTNNMASEIKQHLKGIYNTDYIKECLATHYNHKLITTKEYNELKQHFGVA